MEEAAELFITVKSLRLAWNKALGAFDVAVKKANQKGHNVQIEEHPTSEVNRLFALIAPARTDPQTKQYGPDYDGLYYAFGKFI